jgi:outer membrane immunogenic protein
MESVAMRGLLVAAVALGAVSAAHAADMPDLPILRGGFTDGLSSTHVNWEGFYVGGQGGLGTSDMDFTGATKDIATKLLFDTAIENTGGVSDWPLGGKVSTHGHGFGAFAGYNAQWEDVVLGLELSYMHGSFGGSQTDSMTRIFTDSNNTTDTVTYQADGQVKLKDMASARLRAGYAWGIFLPYAFGGMALGQADIVRTATIYGTQVGTGFNVPFYLTATDAQNSRFVYGYSWGLGVDVMLTAGLFLRGEWQYNHYAASIDTEVNTFHVGLGYKF